MGRRLPSNTLNHCNNTLEKKQVAFTKNDIGKLIRVFLAERIDVLCLSTEIERPCNSISLPLSIMEKSEGDQ